MTSYIFLDAGPLGLICKGDHIAKAVTCREWVAKMEVLGYRILIAEVSDDEVRRKFLQIGAADMLARLDALTATRLFPITRPAMRKAAEFWALLRNDSRSTADPKELDCDTLLAAQAVTAALPGDEIFVATDNVGHLGRYPGIEVMPLDFLGRPR